MEELNEDEVWKENQVKNFSELAKGYLIKSDLNPGADIPKMENYNQDELIQR